MTEVQTLEDLRNVLKASRSKGRSNDKTMAVLADLLDRPGPAAVESITELAAYSGVDPSTLTRLGKKVGFSGFTQLQAVFRRHVSRTQPFYSGHVTELVSGSSGDSTADVLKRQVDRECQRVLAAASSVNVAALDRAVELLIAARHVYVLGLRVTYGLAYFLAGYMQTLRPNVTLLGGPGYALVGDIERIGTEDVLLTLGFRPYTGLALKLTDAVRRSGTPIVAVTDSGSPLEVSGTEGVTIHVDQPYHFDSGAAQFVILQSLLHEMARQLGPMAIEQVRRYETLNRMLDIEVG